MSSAGDDRPPERPEDSDAPEPDVPSPDAPDPEPPEDEGAAPEAGGAAGPEDAEQPGEAEEPEGAEGAGEAQEPSEAEGGEEPQYTVYGKGGEEKRRPAPKRAAEAGSSASSAKGGERPDYKVYRSRPGLRDRFRKPDLAGLRKERRSGGLRDRVSGGGKRHWLRWILIGVFGWILISFIAFAISAQIQKGKLPDGAKQALAGGPDVLAGQNILILGGDRRGDRQGNANGSEGQGPPRADTIMVLHASLTSFRKLSIPRDSYAAIPDCGSQKINASLACNTNSPDGNPASTIKTVEDFLGIDINHLIIIDFDGFAELINTVGGIEVQTKGKVCGDVDGGKSQGGVTIKMKPGTHKLEGDEALAFARIRHNTCDPSEDDTDRAARQQSLLNGIKGRFTDPLRLPYNFIKGPWIGWNAPKAFISDMGFFTMPQVALAAVFGGSGETNVLKPSGAGPGGSLLISQGECRRAVEKLTGAEPKREPACSP